MNRSLWRVPSLVALGLAAVAPASAQTVRFDTAAVLTARPGSPCMIENAFTYGVRDSRGRFIVHSSSSTSLAVFGPDSRCIREVGRQGRGPGEYLDIAAVRLRADSLYVYDVRGNRVTVLDPEFGVRRVFNTAANLGLRIRSSPSGELITNVDLRTPEASGYPLHRFGQDGSYLGSFGVAPVRYAGTSSETSRVFHPGALIWEASPTRWLFRAWSPDGRLVRTIEPPVPADFPPEGASFDYSLRTPPLAAIAGMWTDTRDNLWIMVHVARPDWQRGIEERDGRRRMSDITKVYATVIHVVDSRNGRAVARGRIDGYATPVDPDMIGIVAYDSRSELTYTIVRPQLTGLSRQED